MDFSFGQVTGIYNKHTLALVPRAVTGRPSGGVTVYLAKNHLATWPKITSVCSSCNATVCWHVSQSTWGHDWHSSTSCMPHENLEQLILLVSCWRKGCKTSLLLHCMLRWVRVFLHSKCDTLKHLTSATILAYHAQLVRLTASSTADGDVE